MSKQLIRRFFSFLVPGLCIMVQWHFFNSSLFPSQAGKPFGAGRALFFHRAEKWFVSENITLLPALLKLKL